MFQFHPNNIGTLSILQIQISDVFLPVFCSLILKTCHNIGGRQSGLRQRARSLCQYSLHLSFILSEALAPNSFKNVFPVFAGQSSPLLNFDLQYRETF